MNNWKRLLACLLIACMMVTTFAACSNNNDSTDSNSTTDADANTTDNADEPEDKDEPDTDDTQAGTYNVGIIQLVEHPALDVAGEGFMDALADEGLDVKYDYQNAQGDDSTLSTISQRFVNNDVDLVLAIATGAAQAMAAETSEIPIIGTAITDYEEARLVETNDAPGANITGTSDMNPIQDQIEMIVEFMPEIETLGVVFSSNEDNSVLQAELAKAAAEGLGIEVVVGTVTTTNDIQQVTTSVATKVDAIYIPTDNTYANAMGVVAQVSQETNCPVFCGEENMCMTGGVATLSLSYYKIGYQAGLMAAKILRGEADPSTMPVEFANDFDYILNGDMIDALGIEVPAEYQQYIVYPSQDDGAEQNDDDADADADADQDEDAE